MILCSLLFCLQHFSFSLPLLSYLCFLCTHTHIFSFTIHPSLHIIFVIFRRSKHLTRSAFIIYYRKSNIRQTIVKENKAIKYLRKCIQSFLLELEHVCGESWLVFKLHVAFVHYIPFIQFRFLFVISSWWCCCCFCYSNWITLIDC